MFFDFIVTIPKGPIGFPQKSLDFTASIIGQMRATITTWLCFWGHDLCKPTHLVHNLRRKHAWAFLHIIARSGTLKPGQLPNYAGGWRTKTGWDFLMLGAWCHLCYRVFPFFVYSCIRFHTRIIANLCCQVIHVKSESRNAWSAEMHAVHSLENTTAGWSVRMGARIGKAPVTLRKALPIPHGFAKQFSKFGVNKWGLRDCCEQTLWLCWAESQSKLRSFCGDVLFILMFPKSLKPFEPWAMRASDQWFRMIRKLSHIGGSAQTVAKCSQKMPEDVSGFSVFQPCGLLGRLRSCIGFCQPSVLLLRYEACP